MTISFSLKEKIAVITGASRGIGEAIAETLAAHNAHCILVSRKEEALKQVAEKIRKNGGSADVISCHMGYPERIEMLFKEIKKRFGKVDILINNAGTNPHYGELISADEAVWDKVYEVNLKGPFFMIKHAVPLMKESGGGSIVNVASVSAFKAFSFQGVYSVSKAGLVAMTKVFAKELAPHHIRVNALVPGTVKTKLTTALLETKEIREETIKQIPMGRYGLPYEMSGAVLYLVSEAASFTTGICLTCDGGTLA